MSQLSEGTLRYIWLATLLASPKLPAVTLIGEPEVSLHPELLAQLAELMQEVVQRTQLIVATYSDLLTNLLGTLSSPPYAAWWTNPPPGNYTVGARLIEKSGMVASARPVRVTVGSVNLYAPHRLPDGEFLCYYSQADRVPSSNVTIQYSDSLPARWVTSVGGFPGGYGIWLDSSAINSPQRFYRFVISPAITVSPGWIRVGWIQFPPPPSRVTSGVPGRDPSREAGWP